MCGSMVDIQSAAAQGYADDGAVLICGHILRIICDIVQRTLYGIEQALAENSQSILTRLRWFFLSGDTNLNR